MSDEPGFGRESASTYESFLTEDVLTELKARGFTLRLAAGKLYRREYWWNEGTERELQFEAPETPGRRQVTRFDGPFAQARATVKIPFDGVESIDLVLA